MGLSLLALAVGCGGEDPGPDIAGPWRAWLDSPGGELPFELELDSGEAGLSASIINGKERITVPGVELNAGRVVMTIDHYDAVIEATLHPDGRTMDGEWRRTAGPDKVSRLPFHATAGTAPRFASEGTAGSMATIDGRWSVDFESDDLPAVGLFEADNTGRVTGTFLTSTGDYRFLAGRIDGDRLRLSVFDGAHAFLFDARLREDGALEGDFWSRDTWHETWTARKDPGAMLADPFSQTRWIDGAELGQARFPDLDGTPRSLDDPAFAGKARLLVVFGSWCPNCSDLTEYLVELDRRYRDRGLSILGLAFEMTGNFQRDADQVRTYAAHHGIEYPLLLAGLADKDEASRAFPLIDRVRSYPTTIFLHGDARVRAVHSGFTGPATGEAYSQLRSRFESLIEELLTGVAGTSGPPAAG